MVKKFLKAGKITAQKAPAKGKHYSEVEHSSDAYGLPFASFETLPLRGTDLDGYTHYGTAYTPTAPDGSQAFISRDADYSTYDPVYVNETIQDGNGNQMKVNHMLDRSTGVYLQEPDTVWESSNPRDSQSLIREAALKGISVDQLVAQKAKEKAAAEEAAKQAEAARQAALPWYKKGVNKVAGWVGADPIFAKGGMINYLDYTK